jgi:dihydropyrimidine dehydrogenase (NADP+)
MTDHKFETVREFVGKSLPFFTTHADLVARQKAAKAARVGTGKDAETWRGEISKNST